MCDSSSKQQKWSCEYCTYENFASSLKCTMCKGAKPLLNEDIFRLNSSTQHLNDQQTNTLLDQIPPLPSLSSKNISNLTTAGGSSLNASDSKWNCSACTYVNFARATRCVQCLTKKDVDILSNVNEKVKSLKIYGSDPEIVSSCNNKNSPYGSINNLSNTKGAGARTISPLENRAACAFPPKWSCSVSSIHKIIFIYFSNTIFVCYL